MIFLTICANRFYSAIEFVDRYTTRFIPALEAIGKSIQTRNGAEGALGSVMLLRALSAVSAGSAVLASMTGEEVDFLADASLYSFLGCNGILEAEAIRDCGIMQQQRESAPVAFERLELMLKRVFNSDFQDRLRNIFHGDLSDALRQKLHTFLSTQKTSSYVLVATYAAFAGAIFVDGASPILAFSAAVVNSVVKSSRFSWLTSQLKSMERGLHRRIESFRGPYSHGPGSIHLQQPPFRIISPSEFEDPSASPSEDIEDPSASPSEDIEDLSSSPVSMMPVQHIPSNASLPVIPPDLAQVSLRNVQYLYALSDLANP